jgi:transcriptional regulator with XRE-family HTH domain
MTTMTMAEYARRIGVSKAAISQWKKSGRLILQGDAVDVEATDAHLKRYRREGLPEANPVDETVKRGRPRVKQADELNSSLLNLTLREYAARLAELDWKTEFDWSDDAREQRARDACAYLGWEMVLSDHHDDGHWGGYQVRIRAYLKNGLHEGAIVGGFGFELWPYEVLELARDHVTGWEREGPIDQDHHMEVSPRLLDLLAYPLSPGQERR